MSNSINIRDINPLEHITSDIAKAMANYEAILNGLVTWNTTDNQNVTVRLMTDSDPFFVDYTFPSRSASTKTAIRMLSPDVRGGGFDALNALEMPAVMSDTVTLRFSEVSYPAAQWSLYENAMVYKEDGEASVDYPEHVFVNVKGLNSSDPDAYVKVLTTVAVPSGTAFALGVNCCKAVATWTASQDTSYWKKGMLVLASGGGTLGAYALTGIAGNISPAYDTENWTRAADVLDAMQSNATVRKNGAYLFSESGADDYSDASIYVYLGEDTAKQGSTPNPKSNKQYWMGPYTLIPVKTFGSSTIYRSHPTTDICGYILQSKGSAYPVEVNVLPGQAIAGGDSEPGKGLGVFNTCNYVSWPSSNTPVWHTGRKYGYGDGYTAEMVFHHSSADVKMTNIINYDGPDLDRGLAIYLPAEDVVKDDNGVSVIKEARDGAMFEFMFRIWPNTALNGAESPDLIVNKAHIYVYSRPMADSDRGDTLIAKFSMARLTNFYVWAENVAVPNRPVFYKARFIYSKSSKEWKTYDYYQVPDHVFLSPAGFVDPSERKEGYSGVETAGFPLMQDPFGGISLGRVMWNRVQDNVAESPQSEGNGD